MRAQDAVGGHEGGIDVVVGAGGIRRVGHAPVGAQRRSKVGGAGFARRARADRKVRDGAMSRERPARHRLV